MEIDVQEKIKRLLHTRRRTKKELCDATGISPMGLHDMFKRNDMKLSSLYKILLFFNISITDFFLENKNQEVISLKEQIKELQSNLFHEESTFQMYKNKNDLVLDSIDMLLAEIESNNFDITKQIQNKSYYKFLKRIVKNHAPNTFNEED